MKYCSQCGKEHDYATVLCPKCRDKKRDYDKIYASRPDVKQKRRERKRELRRLNPERIRKQKRDSDAKYKILRTLTRKEHYLYDRLVKALFRSMESRPMTGFFASLTPEQQRLALENRENRDE
jgi:hypothetical protein